MATSPINNLLAALDENAPRRSMLDTYLSGSQPLAYLAPEARQAIGSRFAIMSTNLPRTAVNALAERLRVTGFSGAHAEQAWALWKACDLDQMAPVAHREALGLGEAFAIVWANSAGRATVTVESSHQVAVLRDPATREVTAAVKRWTTQTGTSVVVYEPDVITRYHSDALGTATTTGFRVVGEVPNPLQTVPVVPLRNSDRLLGRPTSEVDDMIPLVDGLNKLLADMMVASEYSGRPRRWATGIELEEQDVLDADGNPTGDKVTVNPFPDSNRMMIGEQPEAKFGQLAAADLSSYEAAVRVLQAQVSAVTGLPPHYLGVHGDQPASADALRASEASLTAKAEARQQMFGRSWEQVGRLMVAVNEGIDPAAVDLSVQWADTSTRSVAQEADAVVKLFTAGLLPASYALKRLGYSDDEVHLIEQARRSDALQAAGTQLAALLPGGAA